MQARVSDRTRSRLKEAAALGVTVVVVTARPPRWLADIEGLHLHGFAIVANGAVVVDLDTGRHLETTALDGLQVAPDGSRVLAGDVITGWAVLALPEGFLLDLAPEAGQRRRDRADRLCQGLRLRR